MVRCCTVTHESKQGLALICSGYAVVARSRQRCATPAPRNRAIFSRETIAPKSDQSIEELCENGRLRSESCSVVSRIHPERRRTNSRKSMLGCFELLLLSECRLWHRELSQLPPLDSRL